MNNGYLTHSIHPYHAKFIPQIPRYFIENFSNVNDLILDPFCGSGTTLLEAMLMERNSIGVDLSFLATKISLAKTSVIKTDSIETFHKEFLKKYQKLECFNYHNFPDKEIWFTNENNQILDKILTLIEKIEDRTIKLIYEVAFSSILKTVSNKRKTWNNGYIADNVLPNLAYKGNVLDIFDKRINSFIKKFKELNQRLESTKIVNTKVYNLNILDFNSEDQFDLVITSPPYPFAVDFVKYYRLSYYWFGFDVLSFAEEETGSRHKRSRKNAENIFFNEMEIIYKHIFELVKPGGFFCMTVGDTMRNKTKISFYDWLLSLFESNGWKLVESNVRKLENQSMSQKRIKEEHIVVFVKKKL